MPVALLVNVIFGEAVPVGLVVTTDAIVGHLQILGVVHIQAGKVGHVLAKKFGHRITGVVEGGTLTGAKGGCR